MRRLTNRVKKYWEASRIGLLNSWVEVRDGVIEEKISRVCYSDLFYSCGTTQIRILVNQHLNPRYISKGDENFSKDILDYYSWVVHESMYKDAFLNGKCIAKWIENGLELDMNKSWTYIMTAACLLREGYENPNMLTFWKFFISKGFTKEEAHVVSSFLVGSLTECSVGYPLGAHGVFGNQLTIASAKGYVNKQVVYKQLPAKKTQALVGINKAINTEEGDEVFRIIKSFSSVKGKGWDAKHVINLTDDKIVNKIKEMFQ